MTDETLVALCDAATRRAAILHASAAWGSDEDGHLMGRLVECITALTAERDALAGIVRGWHWLAVGPDEMGDYLHQRALIKASEPYASPALKALIKT